MLSEVDVRFLELTPEGSASLFVQDSPEHLDRLMAGMPSLPGRVRHRPTHSGHDIHLTPRQLEVLSLAVALGYYETPHGINLRELASHVGISVGAVSELLRRGESIIIKQYVDRLAASRWDDATG